MSESNTPDIAKKKESLNHDEVEKKVLEVIQVQWEQHEQQRELLSILSEKIQMDLNSLGYIGRVETQGSFIRKTYLSEDETFDLLLILSRSEKAKVHQILDALVQRLKKDRVKKQLISVEKHTGKMPYLRMIVDDELINLFVGFEVSPGEETISIFDLIPMHTQYILTHMKEEKRQEVLLFKKFVKAIGVYRSEIGAIGFNGYLCELLVIFYGSFRKAIEAYPLYVLDPLNPKDNVAASVSVDQYNSIIAAANIYFYNPLISFFEDQLCEAPSFDDLVRKIVNSGREIVVLAIDRDFKESEVCWQKALSIRSSFETELRNNNYLLERIKPFVSDEHFGVFVSLMAANPQISLRREGPEVTSRESLQFLRRYSKHADVVAGPFIDDDKWVIHFTKKGQIINDFLQNLVKKNTFVLNVDSFLKIEIKEKMSVLSLDEKLREMYEIDETFSENFFLFIERKPLWICSLKDSDLF
ncbi:MAG: hypothetical protein ACW96U_06980 [Candidatus Heimdallarchaeaceae archaeon]|jgi:tRNA nucleotidyltransferase (CCA-adding enzyme)